MQIAGGDTARMLLDSSSFARQQPMLQPVRLQYYIFDIIRWLSATLFGTHGSCTGVECPPTGPEGGSVQELAYPRL